MKNFYERLKVDKDATIEEIKKAYRLLAKTYHPDKGGDEEVFKEIQEAYATLSEPDKRARYDRGEPIDGESRESRARRNLCKVFDSVIDGEFFDPASSSLIRLMEGEINEKTMEMESDKEDMEIAIRRLEDIGRRLGNTDFLKENIDNTILMIRASIANVNEEIEVSRLMRDMLEGAEYEQDSEEDTQTTEEEDKEIFRF